MLKDIWLVLTGKLSSSEFNHLRSECARQYAFMQRQADLHHQAIKPTMLAVARLIAKIDPAFAQDMFDPKTVAESQDIADRVLRQLRGEDEARAKHGPYA